MNNQIPVEQLKVKARYVNFHKTFNSSWTPLPWEYSSFSLCAGHTHWVSSDFPYFTYPAHDPASNAICVILNVSQIHTQIPSLAPISESHMARQKWCLVSHTSSLLYCPLYDIFPSNPHTAGQMGFLKPQIPLSFSVCHLELNPQVLESPLQCLENPVSGSLCIHLRRDTSFLLVCALAKLNMSASYTVFIFLSLILSFVRCSTQPWARRACSSVFSDLRLHLQSWTPRHGHISLRLETRTQTSHQVF